MALVQVTTDISILKPVDQAKGNGALLFEVVNRGNKRSCSSSTMRRTPTPRSACAMPATAS